MAAVALIVTGVCEHKGLIPSLKAIFPGTEFSIQKVDSFTSGDLSKPIKQQPGRIPAIARFATAIRAAMDPGRKSPAPDFVFGIDDLELVNRDHPEAVVDALRQAVQKDIEAQSGRLNQKAFEKLVEHASRNCGPFIQSVICSSL